MKRQLAALCCALAAASCQAQAGQGGALLPAVQVRDSAGATVELNSVQTASNSVLIVVDATLPSAQVFLTALNVKDQELDPRIKILVLGESAAVERLKASTEGIRGGTWLQGDSTQVLHDLHLPGIPCMIGLRGAQQVAWQFSGIPDRPERGYQMVRDWLQAGDAQAQQQ